MPQKEGLVMISDRGFTHLEFMWGKHAKELVYDDVITFVNFIQNTPDLLQVLNDSKFKSLSSYLK